MMPNRAGQNKTTTGGWICFDSHHNSNLVRLQYIKTNEEKKSDNEGQNKIVWGGITGLKEILFLYETFDKK